MDLFKMVDLGIPVSNDRYGLSMEKISALKERADYLPMEYVSRQKTSGISKKKTIDR